MSLFHQFIQKTDSTGDKTIIAPDLQGHEIYSSFFYKLACCSLAPHATDHWQDRVLVVVPQQAEKLFDDAPPRRMLHNMEEIDLVHAGGRSHSDLHGPLSQKMRTLFIRRGINAFKVF
jgi:hypothetical protein